MSSTNGTRGFVRLLAPARRAVRPGEWTGRKGVTFIVTLAASRSVTLAAREAGMSRKSAYALKSRDAAFAAAWDAALAARSGARKGDEVEEVHAPPDSLGQGDKAKRAAPSISTTARRARDEAARDRFFSRLDDPRRSLPSASRSLSL